MAKNHPGLIQCPNCKKEVVAGLGYKIHVKDCKGGK